MQVEQLCTQNLWSASGEKLSGPVTPVSSNLELQRMYRVLVIIYIWRLLGISQYYLNPSRTTA